MAPVAAPGEARLDGSLIASGVFIRPYPQDEIPFCPDSGDIVINNYDDLVRAVAEGLVRMPDAREMDFVVDRVQVGVLRGTARVVIARLDHDHVLNEGPVSNPSIKLEVLHIAVGGELEPIDVRAAYIGQGGTVGFVLGGEVLNWALVDFLDEFRVDAAGYERLHHQKFAKIYRQLRAMGAM